MRAFAVIMALVLSLGWPGESAAYAVLAHEAIIDSVWDTNLRPLLLKRFPAATPKEEHRKGQRITESWQFILARNCGRRCTASLQLIVSRRLAEGYSMFSSLLDLGYD